MFLISLSQPLKRKRLFVLYKMANFYLIPESFISTSIILELSFAIITFIVGIYAFKVYKLSKQNKSRLFGISFWFFSASYFIQSFLNFLILFKLNEHICTALKIRDVTALNLFGVYIHILFFITGIVTLLYMTLNIKSDKTYFLLWFVSLFAIFFSENSLYSFYILASLYLLVVVFYYLHNYLVGKDYRSLLVLVAFVFLLFGNIHFIFAVNHSIYYIVGHWLELGAYILILLNLILVIKHGKKKR